MTATRHLVVVLGMHRSGTSSVAAAVEASGVDFGRNLIGPKPTVNARGYWEDRDVVALHNRYLAALGSSWDDVLTERFAAIDARHHAAELRSGIRRWLTAGAGSSAVRGVKDPRMCRLMPQWLEVANQLAVEVRVVLVVRSPAEVIASLEARDGMSGTRAALLCLEHAARAERATRNLNRAVVSYERLLSEPDRELERIVRQIGADIGLGVPDAPSLLLDSKLRHQRPAELPGDVPGWARECLDLVWASSQQLAVGPAIETVGPAIETFADIDAALCRFESFVAAAPDDLLSVLADLRRADIARADALHKRVAGTTGRRARRRLRPVTDSVRRARADWSLRRRRWRHK
jgi:hypothetical protein